MNTSTPQYEYSEWSNNIRPCSEQCGFIGPLNSFDPFRDNPFDPCPNCGAQRHGPPYAGRFVYRLEPVKWFPLLKKRVFDHVQWRIPV